MRSSLVCGDRDKGVRTQAGGAFEQRPASRYGIEFAVIRVNQNWNSRELGADRSVDEGRQVVRVQDLNVAFRKQAGELEAAEELAEARLVLTEVDRDTLGLHRVREGAAYAQATDREPEALRIDVSAEVHDDPFHAADSHPEGEL